VLAEFRDVARPGLPIRLLCVWMKRMAPKYHPTPLSGGDRKALTKELGKARAMTKILASQSSDMRAKGEALIQQADRLLCESWNERMWSDGEPLRRQSCTDARCLSGLQGADRAQRGRGSRARHGAVGNAIVVKGAGGCHQETGRKAAGQGQAGRLQGTAPDGAGRRNDQHPQCEEQTLDALARR
jgi:hypothetical protein